MTDRLRCLFVVNVALAAALVAVGCSNDSNSPPATTSPTCSYSVSQPTTTFGPEGGTGSAAVTTASTCTWTAVSTAGFVTVSSGASGTGNGTVQFTVAANTGGDRTATLTVAGTAIAIAQRAAVTVPATLSAPSAKSPIGGQFISPGRATVVINNAVSTGNIGTVTYRFEVSDQPSFPAEPVRTFIADGVAQGAGTTSWVVNHDLGPDVLWYWRARATNGTVTSDYSTVETFSTASPCSLVLTPASATISGAGGTTTIAVTTGNSCTWAASTTNSFLAVSGGGTGNGSISVIVAPNTGAPRTGTVTVTGGGVSATFSITQDVNCVFTSTPNAMGFSNATFTGQIFTVTTSSPSCAWRATSDSTWLIVTAGDTNTGPGTVTYTVQQNTTSAPTPRTGVINITGATGGAGAFVVTQQP
jgi:hypothetical protein